VSTVAVCIEGLHVFNKAGTDRIKVDVAYQFQEVRLLVAQNGFVSVLKGGVPFFGDVYGERRRSR
jgi:hypothetical protein